MFCKWKPLEPSWVKIRPVWLRRRMLPGRMSTMTNSISASSLPEKSTYIYVQKCFDSTCIWSIMDLDMWRANCPYTYLYTKMLTTYNHFSAFWLRSSVVSVLISKNVGCFLVRREEQVSHWRWSDLLKVRSVISLHSKSSIPPTDWLSV